MDRMTPLELRVKALELAVAVCKSDVNRLVTDARRIEAFLIDAESDKPKRALPSVQAA
jgi:hypothetical protein